MESKLLILYILSKIDSPLTNSELSQFILENDYMNYFMVQQFLGELVKSKFIEFSTKDGNEYYHLSEAGKATLSFFTDRISEELKEKIDKSYDVKKIESMKSNLITAKYFKKNDKEYVVILKAIENDIVLFNLSLNISSENQAKDICDKWKKNSSSIYQTILNMFVENS